MTNTHTRTEHEPGTCCLGAESMFLPVPSPEHPLPWRWDYRRGAVVDASDSLVLPIALWGQADRARLEAVLGRVNAEAEPCAS
jgi:hypothetical protein